MLNRNVYDVTIQQMEICILVAETGSFTAAASSIFTTQSTVSKQIKNVEDRTGVVIFKRDRGSSLTLTPAGGIIIERFKKLVKSYNLTIMDAEYKQHGKSQNITVATTPSARNDLFLIPTIDEFIAAHPGVNVHIELHSPEDAKKSIEDGKTDIVICNSFKRSLFYAGDLDCVDLIKCNWSIGMRTTNLLAGRKQLLWHDLREQNFVVVNDYVFLQMLNDSCGKAGFSPKIAYACDFFCGVADNCRDSKSVFLTCKYLSDYGKDGYQYYDMPGSQSSVLMITKSRETDPLVLDFSKQLVRYVKEHNLNDEGI